MNMQDYNRVFRRAHIRAACREEILRDGAAGAAQRIPSRRFSAEDSAPALTGLAACVMLLICGGIILSGLREGGLTAPASSAAESMTETSLQTTTTVQTQTAAHTVQIAEITADVTETAALTARSSTAYTADTVQTTASTTVRTTAVTTAPPAEETTTAPQTTAEHVLKFGGYIPMHMSDSDYQEYKKALKTELFGNPKQNISALPEAEQYRYYDELRTRTGSYQIDENPITLLKPLVFWIAEKDIPIEQGYALLDLVAAGEKLPEELRTEIEQTEFIAKGDTEEALLNSLRGMAGILKELWHYTVSLAEQDYPYDPEEGFDWCTQEYHICLDPPETTTQTEKEGLS